MIEQVKGFSYSVLSLLGASSFLPMLTEGEEVGGGDDDECETISTEKRKKSWWKVSLASPKIWDPASSRYKDVIIHVVVNLDVSLTSFSKRALWIMCLCCAFKFLVLPFI